MYHPFSVAETLKDAWNIFKKNFITIIVYSVIVFLILAVLAFVVEFFVPPNSYYLDMLASFIMLFVQAYTTLGLYKLIFTLIDSDLYEFEFSQIVPKVKMIFSYLAVAFLLAIVFVTFKLLLENFVTNELLNEALFIAFVIFGLYITLRIMFFNTFIVDDDSGPIESLRQSFQLTKGYLLKVLSILGIILLLIALPAQLSQFFPPASLFIIFSYPFVNIVLMITYRKLVYSHQDVDDVIAETL